MISSLGNHAPDENSFGMFRGWSRVIVEVRSECIHSHADTLPFSSRSWFLRSSSTFFVSWARTSMATGKSCLPWPRLRVSVVVTPTSSWRRRTSTWTSELESARRRKWVLPFYICDKLTLLMTENVFRSKKSSLSWPTPGSTKFPIGSLTDRRISLMESTHRYASAYFEKERDWVLKHIYLIVEKCKIIYLEKRTHLSE